MMRPDLAAIAPERIRRLPVDPERGYPVPWFVQWMADGKPTQPGTGKPEFRIADHAKYRAAIRAKLCWVCGDKLGRHLGFVIGPMCSINRVSSDPPAHRDCAEFSLRACPFLVKPQMERREGGLPEHRPVAGGVMFPGNPGLMALWMTVDYQLKRDESGQLFKLGEPVELTWWREGRPATDAEVVDGFLRGVATLGKVAEENGNEKEFKRAVDRALLVLPFNAAKAVAHRLAEPRPASDYHAEGVL